MNLGFMYAIGAAITWGMVYTIDQRVLSGTSAITLLFIDSLITAIVVLPFVFFDLQPIKELFSSGKTNLLLIFLSLFLAVIANFLILSAIKSIGASSASIIEIAYPFFVVLFSFFFFKAVPNVYFFIGGLLIFIGSALITYFH